MTAEPLGAKTASDVHPEDSHRQDDDPEHQPHSKGVSGTDGPVSRYLNRPISTRISRRVWMLPVTPDQWTYASFGAVCAAAAAFAAGANRTGALLVHAGSVLDGVDGEVARLQGACSAQGALLDVALDRVSDVVLLSGLALGAGGRRIDWLLALAASTGILTASMVKERVGAEGESVSLLQRDEASDGPAGALLAYAGRDGRLFAVTLCGVIGQPRLALLLLAALSNLRLLRRLRAARAMLHQRDGA